MSKVITKAEAKDRGLARFYTGRACRRGHVAERYVASGNCVECCTNVYSKRIYGEEEGEVFEELISKLDEVSEVDSLIAKLGVRREELSGSVDRMTSGGNLAILDWDKVHRIGAEYSGG